MKASDDILTALADAGVDTIFAVYGAAMGEIADACTRQTRIRYVATIHEQAAGFAAEGYAKVKGVPGVALVTSGPGGGNLVTAAQNCYFDSVPAVFITGQVNSKFMSKSYDQRQLGFQEAPMTDIFRPIVKHEWLCEDSADLPFQIRYAIHKAMEGRPGPVLLDIPIDIQKGEGDLSSIETFETPSYDPHAEITEFLRDLEKSERPAMMIGGGCARYKEEFYALAEKLQIPCFPTWNALDIVTSDSLCYGGRIGTYGGAGRNFGIQNADLLLCIGTRIPGRITGGMPETFARGAKKYVLDIDPGLLKPHNQPVKADVNILCDAGVFMRELAKRVRPHKDFNSWQETCRQWAQKYDPVKPEHFEAFHHYGFMRKLSQAMPADATIVADTGGNVITFAHAFETKRGQRYFTNNGNTPMGFSMCAAIGAWFAKPQDAVWCIIGDGGFQMNVQELQTIKNYGCKVKVLLFNNKILGNTVSYQKANYAGRTIGGTLPWYSTPDFVAVSKAYGIPAFTIDSWWAMDEYLPQIMALDGPCVVDIVHEGFCDYAPKMISWSNPIEDMTPYLPRDEFRKNMRVEPWEGWENNK